MIIKKRFEAYYKENVFFIIFRLPPLNDCCLLTAEMSSKIEQLFPQLSIGKQESSQVRKKQVICKEQGC